MTKKTFSKSRQKDKPSRRAFLAGVGGALLAANLNLSLPVYAENKNMNDMKSDIDFLDNRYSTTILESALYLINGTHSNTIFTHPGLLPHLSIDQRIIAGYAVTCEFSTDPDDNRGKRENIDYWEYVFKQPGPKIAVAVDVSREPGSGSSWGQLNAHIHKALGCSGVITNGGIRDIEVFKEIGFLAFSGSLTVGHGNPHFVKFGEPVTLYGAHINSSDVVVADQHGAIVIPKDALPYIEEAAEETIRRVKIVSDYCKTPNVTPQGLLAATGRTKPATPWKPKGK